MNIKGQGIVLSVAWIVSGCAVPTDRAGFSEGEFYERQKPYYENTLAFRPRVSLRAVTIVSEVAVSGLPFGVNVLRRDIELFFAGRVTDQEQRLELTTAAVRITCPNTDLTGLEEKIAYFDPNYVVLKNVDCIGHTADNRDNG